MSLGGRDLDLAVLNQIQNDQVPRNRKLLESIETARIALDTREFAVIDFNEREITR